MTAWMRSWAPPEQLTAIDALDTGERGGPESAAITRENFGRERAGAS